MLIPTKVHRPQNQNLLMEYGSNLSSPQHWSDAGDR